MKKYMFYCESVRLYVAECIPEINMIVLSSEKDKASVYMDIDVEPIKSHVQNYTGLIFKDIQV